jgi:type II secretory pathway component PulM
MAPQIGTLPDKALSYFKSMWDDILIIYGEKGFAPFKKPVTFAAPVLLVLYFGFYGPAGERLARARGNVTNMAVVAEYAEQYETAKQRMALLQRKLPLVKDKDEWLSYVISSTAKKTGVSVDSQSAQRESEVGGYLVVSREISTTTTYHGFGRWLAEIENSPIFLRVTELSVSRDENNPGNVKVTFILSTVFPRQGGGR